MSKRILLAPSLTAGMGTGHLMRCLALADRLEADVGILLRSSDAPRLRAMIPEDRAVEWEALPRSGPWDLIVLDRRCSTAEVADTLAARGCLVGLDEGGAVRRFLPYLIDSLPGVRRRHPPNVASLAFLQSVLPEPGAADGRGPEVGAAPGGPRPFRRVLISFGGEDPAHLTESLLELLDRSGMLKGCELTVVQGPAFGQRRWVYRGHSRRLQVLRNVRDLKTILGGYDLVFTSFGLTCLEALSAGVAVIVLNPGRYHHRLTRRFRLPEIGVKSPSAAKLKRLLAHPGSIRSRAERFRARFLVGRRSLCEKIGCLEPPECRVCPACGSGANPVVARFAARSYARCAGCGLIYLLDFSGRRPRYDGAYFRAEYEAQYGRTYLEDFQSIKRLGEARLEILGRLTGGAGGRRLLEVGCAYGPFLQAAAEAGYAVSGIDVAAEAAAYARDRLGLPCRCVSFQDYRGEPVDVLCMWYVIEHLPDLGAALDRVRSLLAPGGVFAFSTPNARGISGRRSLRSFLENSPQDHCTVWFPASARRLMRRFGFRVAAVRVTGHHPERFPFGRRLEEGGVLWRAAAALSRLLRLGDTFEIYARPRAAIPAREDKAADDRP